MSDGPTRVVAQGTFEILHPGHLHYLHDAADRGDELHVIVARRRNVTHKPPPVLPDRQRRDVIAALDVVDRSHLGHPEDILQPVGEIAPDVVVLGHDQHHEVESVETALRERGIGAEVVRASAREPRYHGELLSTARIREAVVAADGEAATSED